MPDYPHSLFRHAVQSPLAHAGLHTIRERQPWIPDVIALRREVKQAHSEFMRWHQVSKDLLRPPGLMGDIHDELLGLLTAEDCVIERDQDVPELRAARDKLRKEMAPR